MKAADAKRGVLLAAAKRRIAAMKKAAERTTVHSGCDAASCARGGWFEIGSFCADGACQDVPGVEVDLVTARRILAAIEPILDEELKKLGIEP